MVAGAGLFAVVGGASALNAVDKGTVQHPLQLIVLVGLDCGVQ
ncbi:hypothetical protein BH23ACT6_BH23ACT6_23590 [soil metagenome]